MDYKETTIKRKKLRSNQSNNSFISSIPTFFSSSQSNLNVRKSRTKEQRNKLRNLAKAKRSLPNLERTSSGNSVKSASGKVMARFLRATTFGPKSRSKKRGKKKKPEIYTMDNYECPLCQKLVSENELVAYKERAYHLDCYRCSQCDVHLPRTDQPNIRKGKFLCDSCFGNKPMRPMPFQRTTMLPSALTGQRVTKSSSISHIGSRSTNVRSRRAESTLKTMNTDREFDMVAIELDMDFPDEEVFDFDKVRDQIKYLSDHYKEQIMASVCQGMVLDKIAALPLEEQKRFYRCVMSGLLFRNSKVGAYVLEVDDYELFKDFFFPLIHKIQNIPDHITLKVDVNGLKTRYQKTLRHEMDLSSLEKPILSCEFKFIRNVAGFPLIGGMNITDRMRLEELLLPVFEALIISDDYGGMVRRIDADGSNLKREAVARQTIDWAKEMPKNKVSFIPLEEFNRAKMRTDKFNTKLTDQCKIDKFLSRTRIAKFWPHGSGVYFSKDKKLSIYYNHEDHIEFMYSDTQPDPDLTSIYNELKEFLKFFETRFREVHKYSLQYVVTERLGFITSCPTRLGAAFIPSLSLQLPNILDDGEIARIAKENNFQYKLVERRSNTVEADTEVKLSPVRKIFETEEMIVRNLYNLIPKVLREEDDADFV